MLSSIPASFMASLYTTQVKRHRFVTNLLKSGFALSLSGLSVFALPLQANAQTILVKDANVVTNSAQGLLDNTDVLIRDGKISEIGKNLQAPAGTQILSAENQWVSPGLFLPFTRIGLVEISLEAATNDISAQTSKTTVSDSAIDSFNPKAPAIAATRIEGITHAAITPDAGKSIFGGLGLIANTTGTFDSVEIADAFIFIRLGETGARLAGGSRAASLSQLRAALDDAGAYPSRYDAPTDGDILSRRDASALFKAARGQMPLVIEADRASDILRIIDIKTDYGGLDIIVLGATEAWMIAEEIKAAGLKVMIDPHENLPFSFEAVGAREDSLVILDKSGVEYAIMNRSQDTGHNSRVLPQHAGNAVGYGLDWQKAFAAISSTPAQWFGIDIGELKSGSDTLVVWDGDPLEVTVSPTYIIINGETQSLQSRQTALRDRYNPIREDDRPHKYR